MGLIITPWLSAFKKVLEKDLFLRHWEELSLKATIIAFVSIEEAATGIGIFRQIRTHILTLTLRTESH